MRFGVRPSEALTWRMRNSLRRFLTASTISLYGDWLTTVALVVIVVRVTGVAAAPAGYMLARVAPRVVGAGAGGALADRFRPHRVLGLCSLLQAALVGGVLLSERAGNAWGIYAAVAIGSLVNGASRAAFGAVMPGIVEAERLGRANALYFIGFSSAQVVAPAIGAALLAWSGPDLLLVLDMVSFLVAAPLVLSLPWLPGEATAPSGMWDATVEGLRTVRRDRVLTTLAAAHFSEGMVATAASSVLVLAAAERFGGDSRVGILYAAVGLGTIVAGFIALRAQPRPVSRAVIAVPAVISVVAISSFSVARPLGLALVPLFVDGLGGTLFETWGATEMQGRVDRNVLGSVSGAIVLTLFSGMMAGATAALVLVPLIHWDHALFWSCCLALGVLGGGVFLPAQAEDRRAADRAY